MHKNDLPKILMVDDSNTNLLVLEHNLNQLNVNIFKANSGHEGLQYFYEQEFAVVLLDVQMLDLDGFQTAELMRKYESEKKYENHIQRQTPIIFVTAVYNNDPYIQRAYTLGGVDYLVKPINPLILKSKVAVFIELYQNYYQIQQQAKQLKIANEQLASDINKRQKIELALRQSEEKFRSAFDYAAIGMALVGLDGKWLQVNRSLCEILGYSEEELLQKNIKSITHPDDIDIDLISSNQLLQEEINSYQIEKRYLHKENRIVWILLNSSLIEDETENKIYFIMQIQDISERKIAEESMLKLANIVASSDDGIISTDLSGIITSWNKGAEKIYGYLESEIKGQLLNILLPESHNTESKKIIALIKEGKNIDNYETLRLRKDDKIIDVSLTISPIKDTKGQIIGIAKIARDITERKRIEEALRRLLHENSLILNSAGEGICGIDEQGKFRFVNPAAAKMLGYEIIELISQPINLILTNSSSFSNSWQSSISYQWNNELFVRQNNSTFPVEYIITPLGEKNKMLGAVLTFKDISDRLIIEQMKDEFISVVSHELRTPLTSIRGALGLLAGGLLKTHPDKAQRMLDIAVINTDRLVRLINDILDIERIESGKETMEKNNWDINDLINQAIEGIQNLAEKAKINIESTSVTTQIWADGDRIIQTITNLVSNAIKFSPPHSTIWINADWDKENPKFMLFSFKDQGRGIPEDKLESIFGRFQQIDASDSRQKGGTGLGLAICRSIIQQHDGKIWVESEVGKGSTFYFTIPVFNHLSNLPETSKFDLGYTPLILICDDDLTTCLMVEKLTAKWGYRVITANTAEQTIELGSKLHPDAILLDLMMPGINGWEIMSCLKQMSETQDIPIIIFNALSINQNNINYPDILGWLNKPVDEDLLFQTLAKCLHKPTHIAQVLLLEDDADLALVLKAMFERYDIQFLHAQSAQQAVYLSQNQQIDLIVLDVGLTESDGFQFVDWLREDEYLCQIPLVVYSAKDLDQNERKRLELGQTQFFNKGRITPEEFEQKVIALLHRILKKEEHS